MALHLGLDPGLTSWIGGPEGNRFDGRQLDRLVRTAQGLEEAELASAN
jgi:hypothetical protein